MEPSTESQIVQRKETTHSDASSITKEKVIDSEAQVAKEVSHDEAELEEAHSRQHALYLRFRPFILAALAATILGWWISATVLEATRHRWIVQTLWAWFFIGVIAFRFIPTSIVTKPVAAVWIPLVQEPFYRLPYNVRLGAGWLALIGIVFGSAFGFKPSPGSNYGDRAISVLGLFIFQFCFWATSKSRSQIPW
jgi:CNT family concentrative nucleoside transporter